MHNDDRTGSGGGHGLKAATGASLRAASVPEYGKTYRYTGGGHIGIPTSRRNEALRSKNERGKFAKELRTARVFAHQGYRIDFTPSGAGKHDVFCNGVPADIKRTASHSNIQKYARHATKKTGRENGAVRVCQAHSRNTARNRKTYTNWHPWQVFLSGRERRP